MEVSHPGLLPQFQPLVIRAYGKARRVRRFASLRFISYGLSGRGQMREAEDVAQRLELARHGVHDVEGLQIQGESEFVCLDLNDSQCFVQWDFVRFRVCAVVALGQWFTVFPLCIKTTQP